MKAIEKPSKAPAIASENQCMVKPTPIDTYIAYIRARALYILNLLGIAKNKLIPSAQATVACPDGQPSNIPALSQPKAHSLVTSFPMIKS